MSVLPLVFPSNFSCFSLGSYKEELNRRRELPVPPLPKRCGLLARSEDNLTVPGLHPLIGFKLSYTTPTILTRHSSYTWLHGEREDMVDGIVGRRKQHAVGVRPVESAVNCLGKRTEEVRTSQSSVGRSKALSFHIEDEQQTYNTQSLAMHSPYRENKGWATNEKSEITQEASNVDKSSRLGETIEVEMHFMDDGVRGEAIIKTVTNLRDIKCNKVQAGSVTSETALPPDSNSEHVFNIVSDREHSQCRAGEDCAAQQASNVQALDESRVGRDTGENTNNRDTGDCVDMENTDNRDTESAVENRVTEESSSKISMYKRTEKSSIFRNAINRLSLRSRNKKENNDVKKEEGKSREQESIVTEPHVESIPEVKNINLKETKTDKQKTISPNKPLKSPPLAPSSATSIQSRPISQLDSALKSFKLAAAKSRENLLLPRPDVFLASPLSSGQTAKGVTRNCPPFPFTRWRQKPPPPNSYVDSEWKKLSASMINLGQSKRNLAGKETDLSKTEVTLRSSNMSLDTGSFTMGMEKVVVEESRVTRAQSMNVLDVSVGERKMQIPCNQLMEMNPYQRRVQVSMERLSVPSWYNPPDTPNTPHTPRWRQAGGSSSAGWRRYVSQSASPSTTSTLERNSTPLSSQRYRSRYRTLPSSTRSPSKSSINSSTSTVSSTPSKQVYIGWRSQERLDIGPAYLTSPAQRLASSVIPCSVKPVVATSGIDTAKEGIKEVTEAILDFCNSPIGDKPTQVKEAWPHVEDESDDTSDNLDDDSGIDRSDDFTQELLNEE